MYRATTPTHKWNFPSILPVGEIEDFDVTYSQYDEIVVHKGKGDVIIDTENNFVMVKLSQAETKKFSTDSLAEVQLIYKYNGEVIPTPTYSLNVKRVLNDEVFQNAV